MSRATPQMRSFAKHLIAHETLRNKSSEAKTPAAFRVTDKLRPHLATLMGKVGFRALLSRALALANAEVSWLGAVNVNGDGALEGLEALNAQLDPAKFLEGGVVVLAQLLGLLEAFVGPGLTSRLLAEIWPQVSFDDTGFGSEEKNEVAK
jgi:hypothetical protein